METEYVEEARERTHQVAIASGTGHVQDKRWEDLGSFFRRVFRSITARTRHDHLKVDLITDVSHSLLTDSSCRQNMEFEELVKVLNIGDRIRVLCETGLLWPRKSLKRDSS